MSGKCSYRSLWHHFWQFTRTLQMQLPAQMRCGVVSKVPGRYEVYMDVRLTAWTIESLIFLRCLVDLPDVITRWVIDSIGSLIRTITTFSPPWAIKASLISSVVRSTLRKIKCWGHNPELLLRPERIAVLNIWTYPSMTGIISSSSLSPSRGGTQFHALFSSISPSFMYVLLDFDDMSLMIFEAFVTKAIWAESDGTWNTAAAAAMASAELGFLGAAFRVLAKPRFIILEDFRHTVDAASVLHIFSWVHPNKSSSWNNWDGDEMENDVCVASELRIYRS